MCVLFFFSLNGGLPCCWCFVFIPCQKAKMIFRLRGNVKSERRQFGTAERLRSEIGRSLREEPRAPPGAGNQSKHSCCHSFICVHVSTWCGFTCVGVHILCKTKTVVEKRKTCVGVFAIRKNLNEHNLDNGEQTKMKQKDFEFRIHLFFIQLTLASSALTLQG